jgi:hypothetical protein
MTAICARSQSSGSLTTSKCTRSPDRRAGASSIAVRPDECVRTTHSDFMYTVQPRPTASTRSAAPSPTLARSVAAVGTPAVPAYGASQWLRDSNVTHDTRCRSITRHSEDSSTANVVEIPVAIPAATTITPQSMTPECAALGGAA